MAIRFSDAWRYRLDIFGEFSDQEIFDALRRVHLIKPGEMPSNTQDGENESPFFNLDGEVAEGVRLYSRCCDDCARADQDTGSKLFSRTAAVAVCQDLSLSR